MTPQESAQAAYQWAWSISNDKHSLTVPLLCGAEVMRTLERFERYEDAFGAIVELLGQWDKEGRAGFVACAQQLRAVMGLT